MKKEYLHICKYVERVIYSYMQIYDGSYMLKTHLHICRCMQIWVINSYRGYVDLVMHI